MHIYRRSVGFRWLLCFKYLCLYNNDAKTFGTEGVLCRRFENVESEMVYITRGKCNVYYASRVGVFFFAKSFRVPKIVPKVSMYYTRDC